jgi:hypothetical protein
MSFSNIDKKIKKKHKWVLKSLNNELQIIDDKINVGK